MRYQAIANRGQHELILENDPGGRALVEVVVQALECFDDPSFAYCQTARFIGDRLPRNPTYRGKNRS